MEPTVRTLVLTIPFSSVAMAQLRNEVQVNRPMSRLAIESWTMQMWAHLHRSGAAPPSSEVLPLSATSVKKVADRMRERLAEDLSIKELAGLVRLGPRQFCRRYRAATGTTPARAMEAIRLDQAAMLLSTTVLRLQISRLTADIPSPSTLPLPFGRRFEVTPTQYRSSFE